MSHRQGKRWWARDSLLKPKKLGCFPGRLITMASRVFWAAKKSSKKSLTLLKSLCFYTWKDIKFCIGRKSPKVHPHHKNRFENQVFKKKRFVIDGKYGFLPFFCCVCILEDFLLRGLNFASFFIFHDSRLGLFRRHGFVLFAALLF